MLLRIGSNCDRLNIRLDGQEVVGVKECRLAPLGWILCMVGEMKRYSMGKVTASFVWEDKEEDILLSQDPHVINFAVDNEVHRYRVYLDGVMQKDVDSCFAGDMGWVKIILRDSKGVAGPTSPQVLPGRVHIAKVDNNGVSTGVSITSFGPDGIEIQDAAQEEDMLTRVSQLSEGRERIRIYRNTLSQIEGDRRLLQSSRFVSEVSSIILVSPGKKIASPCSRENEFGSYVPSSYEPVVHALRDWYDQEIKRLQGMIEQEMLNMKEVFAKSWN